MFVSSKKELKNNTLTSNHLTCRLAPCARNIGTYNSNLNKLHSMDHIFIWYETTKYDPVLTASFLAL